MELTICNRKNASLLQGKAIIDIYSGGPKHYCMVLLPDDWKCPERLSFKPQEENKYSLAEMRQLEAAGAVFFNLAQPRDTNKTGSGYTWTSSIYSTPEGASEAYCVSGTDNRFYIARRDLKTYDLPVRLVRDAK